MLNRLYIVIGVLAILVLGGGFLIPGWIDWSSYRNRIEVMAEAGLGTDVIIAGEIDFSLLPQPRMRFGRTFVGPADAPLLEIQSIVAEFSLMDFLRDRFTVTKLVLESPVISLSVDEDGALEIPILLPESFEASNISVASAEIKNGVFRFADERTGENWQANGFAGELKISNVRGPYSLQGIGDFGGREHSLRINTSAINESDELQASVFFRSKDGAYSFASDGLLSLGTRPAFNGDATYRATPVGEEVAERVQGDFVFASEVEVSAEKILLSAFLIQPDENRAGTRLTGAAVVQLGESRSFDAVISGGVVSMAPRDLREESADDPYELVRLLSELPAPFVPPLPGRVGVDIAELDLRAFSLREVRIDATTNGEVWSLADFAGQLPGDSRLTLTGTLFEDSGSMGYDGSVSLSSSRLDALAMLWHRSEEGNALFNRQANMTADLSLSGGNLGLANGIFTFEQQSHDFAGLFTLAGVRHALVTARFGALDRSQSDAVLALLPDFAADGAFGNTFPTGSVDVVAQEASLFGLAGKDIAVQLDWDSTGLQIERLSVQDYGGARLALTGALTGTLAEPILSGGGRLTLSEATRDAFLPVLMERLGADPVLENWIARSLPIDANVDLGPPEENGEQALSAVGLARNVDIELELVMANGLARLSTAPMVFEAILRSDDPDGLTAQLGLGEVALLPSDTPVTLNLRGEGTISNSVDAIIVAEGMPNQQGVQDRLAYAGMLILSDLSELRGRGIVDFALTDFAPLLDLVGANGLHVPGLEGTADISFSGGRTLTLDNLVASTAGAAGATVGGQLSISEANDVKLVSGQLAIAEIEAENVLVFLGGPASLIMADGQWPEGPIDLGSQPRTTRGRLNISMPGIVVGGKPLIDQASFDLIWDANKIGLENISGTNGAGTITGRLEVCCSSLGAQKQLSGRLSVSGVTIEGIAPVGVSDGLAGNIDGGLLFDATGASVAEMVDALSGEGSFSIAGLSVEKFDPSAFSALASVEDMTTLDADALTSIVAVTLDQGSFDTPLLGGVFRLAGGTLRADNLAAENEDAHLLGGISLDLSDLSLAGSWSLTPTQLDDPQGLIDQNTARITAVLGGTLTEPQRELDLGQMVDAIQVRALEIELERLEILRAEQETRSAAAAAERARLMEIEAQRLEAEGARLAAEVEARRQAEEAARLAAEQEALIFDLNSQDPLVFDPSVPDLLEGQ